MHPDGNLLAALNEHTIRYASYAWAEVYLRSKWHLDPSSRLATIDMGKKLRGCCALFLGGARSPSNTKSPAPRPTSISSGTLVHPAVWPQWTWAENWGPAENTGCKKVAKNRHLCTIATDPQSILSIKSAPRPDPQISRQRICSLSSAQSPPRVKIRRFLGSPATDPHHKFHPAYRSALRIVDPPRIFYRRSPFSDLQYDLDPQIRPAPRIQPTH